MIDRIGFLTAIPATVAGWFGLRKPKQESDEAVATKPHARFLDPGVGAVWCRREKRMLGNKFSEARRVMGQHLNTVDSPGSIRDSYVANIAMLIWDDQEVVHAGDRSSHKPLDLCMARHCNIMAERILDRMFHDK